MKVYCAHPAVQPYGYGGFLVCGLCGSEWYSVDASPTVVIAVTEESEIKRFPFLREVRDRQKGD